MVCAKFPLTAICLIERLEPAAAVNVSVLAALVVPTATVPKSTMPGNNCAGATAFPERLTTCGVKGALSLIVTAPLIDPIVPGAKITSIAQLA